MSNKTNLMAFVDCARNSVLTKESLKKFIDYISAFGYTALEIYTEDLFEVDGEEMFGYLRGKYSKDDLKEIVAYGESKGIELIPCIETLAHLEHIFRWNEYRSIRDIYAILLVEEERTYTLIENMIKTVRECFKSDYIDICYDEAPSIGRGRYLDKHGYKDSFDLAFKHLNRVCDIAKKYGFTPYAECDTFYAMKAGDYYCYDNPDVIKDIAHLVPEGIRITYWDYFCSTENCKKMIQSHRHFNRPLRFLGSINNWTSMSPRIHSAMRWLKSSIKACIEEGITDIGIAGFGDDGHENSYFANLPSFLCAAEFSRGNFDIDSIKEKFQKIVGISFDDFLKLCYPIQFDNDNISTRCEKMFLFNDPFCGIYDDVVYRAEEQMENHFPTYIKELEEAEQRAGEFAYLFRFARNMCDVLRIKYNLGVKTRAAYKSGDKQQLAEMLPIYDETIKRVETVYDSFRTLWYKERKGNGFEVQAIRFGGLIQRLKDCKLLIEAYLNGEREILEELEEDIKVVNDSDNEFKESKYGKIVTVNSLTHFNFFGI